jgi:hypothetical protein
MRMSFRGLRGLALATLVAASLAACGDSNNDGNNPPPGPQEATLTGDVNGTRTLSPDTTYTIQGFFRVSPGATLIVPAGTQLLSDPDTRGTLITRRCDSVNPSGRLIIQGTAADPVVFRPAVSAGTARVRGTGGGVLLAGCAPINLPGGSGISEGVSEPFGGTNANDSSGEIHYLVIEFGGVKVTPDNEINGLTMAGVGNGTVIDHVQSHFIADDGFEWFGGTVNASFLVSSANDDDNLDCDNGWVGTVQFAFVIQDRNLANRGEECDNDANGSGNLPFTIPSFWNVTYVGTGVARANSENNDGLYIRRNSGSLVHNAIVANFGNVGAVIDGDASFAQVAAGNLVLNNILFFNNQGLASPAAQAAGTPLERNINRFSGGAYVTTDVATAFGAGTFVFADPQFTSVDFSNPINGNQPNPLPQAGSPALNAANAATPTGPGIVDGSADYLGAFGSNNWIDGWTTWVTQ